MCSLCRNVLTIEEDEREVKAVKARPSKSFCLNSLPIPDYNHATCKSEFLCRKLRQLFENGEARRGKDSCFLRLFDSTTCTCFVDVAQTIKCICGQTCLCV